MVMIVFAISLIQECTPGPPLRSDPYHDQLMGLDPLLWSDVSGLNPFSITLRWTQASQRGTILEPFTTDLEFSMPSSSSHELSFALCLWNFSQLPLCLQPQIQLSRQPPTVPSPSPFLTASRPTQVPLKSPGTPTRQKQHHGASTTWITDRHADSPWDPWCSLPALTPRTETLHAR